MADTDSHLTLNKLDGIKRSNMYPYCDGVQYPRVCSTSEQDNSFRNSHSSAWKVHRASNRSAARYWVKTHEHILGHRTLLGIGTL
jgi:hypothetical protein